MKILHGLHYQTENLIIDFTLLPYCFTFYKKNAVLRSFIIREDLLTHRISLPSYSGGTILTATLQLPTVSVISLYHPGAGILNLPLMLDCQLTIQE